MARSHKMKSKAKKKYSKPSFAGPINDIKIIRENTSLIMAAIDSISKDVKSMQIHSGGTTRPLNPGETPTASAGNVLSTSLTTSHLKSRPNPKRSLDLIIAKSRQSPTPKKP